jgi:hypothetical protein
MPTVPSGAAIQRSDAPIDDSPQVAAVPARDLVDLAAAIGRVEALMAADATPQPDGSNAIERIADIAFVLHERDVEASLCDALDAAVREIADADSLKLPPVARIRQAAELLREVSGRVNEMLARADSGLSHGVLKAAPAARELSAAEPEKRGGEKAANAELLVDDLFATHACEDDGLAALLQEASMPSPSTREEANSNKAASDEITSQAALSDEHPTVRGMAIAPPSPPDASRPLNPEDDPGDLFEPMASAPVAAVPQHKIEAIAPLSAPAGIRISEPTGAALGEAIGQRGGNTPPVPAAESGTFRDVASPTPPASSPIDAGRLPQSAPRPAPNDPLAPMRALSEEEMIALFS